MSNGEFIEVLSDKAKKDISELVAQLEIVSKQVSEINREFKQTKIPSQGAKRINDTRRATQKLNEHQKEARRINRALERQQAKLNRASGKQIERLQKLRYETQQQNRLSKQRAIISSRLSTEYQKQQAQINLLSRRYQELATKQELGIRLSNKEQRELTETTAKINQKQNALKRVDANMGVYNRNVGNYKSAWGGVGSMLKSTLVAFGGFAAIDIARDIYRQTKEINALNFSLKQVTESQQAFNQASEFIIKLSDRAGVGINNMQKAYTKFFASAKATSLTLEEIQEIFENVAVAGGVLGMSTEDVEGAMRALEQMLSKGKVQAEEIRGQLGERLPGAYQTLAKSMGITTEELSKQLELGNVYADDVLPKFARQLAKTYDLDTINKVDTLTASQNRLGNAWNLLIRDIEGGKGVLSETFKLFIDGSRIILENWRRASKTIGKVFKSFEPIFKSIDRLITQIFGDKGTSKVKAFGKVLFRALRNAHVRMFASMLKLAGANLNGLLSIALETGRTFDLLLISFANLVAAFRQFDPTSPFESMKNITIKAGALAGNFKHIGKNLGEAFKDGFMDVWLFKEAVLDKDEVDETNEEAEKKGRAFAESIAKGLRDNDPEIILGEGIKFKDEIEGLKDYLDQLEEIKKTTEFVMDYIKGQIQEDLFFGELQGLGEMFNIDIGQIRDNFKVFEDINATTFEKVEAIADSAGQVIKGISQTIMQNELRAIDMQIQANARKYNTLISQAEGNAEQQEILRRRQEKQRMKLEAQRAEAQKRAAKFDIITNTATAIIKTFANLGYPAGIPAAAAIASIGALKLAVVEGAPVPQYKKGRKGGKAEWAILGDGGKHEPILDKHGNLKNISPDTDTYMPLAQGDTVLPSIDKLNDDILKSAMLDSITMNANKMKSSDKNAEILSRMQAENRSIKKEMMKALKDAKFVNNNNTKVDLGDNFRKQNLKNK